MLPSRTALMLTAVAAAAFIPGAAIADNLDTCIRECSNATPNCLLVSGPARARLARPFSRLHTALAARTGQITASQIQRMFNTMDPCARSTTVFTATSITNSGNSCVVRQEIDLPRDSVTVSIHIPEELSAIRRIDGQNNRVTFAAAKQRPTLFIDNKFLNTDWGGPIRAAYFAPTYSVLQTGGGRNISCIRFRYQGAS